MVLLLFAVASIVHFGYLAWQRSRGSGPQKGMQISLLLRPLDGVGISPPYNWGMWNYMGYFMECIAKHSLLGGFKYEVCSYMSRS